MPQCNVMPEADPPCFVAEIAPLHLSGQALDLPPEILITVPVM